MNPIATSHKVEVGPVARYDALDANGGHLDRNEVGWDAFRLNSSVM